jgi:GntR family transcriptional regulator/MocR family aminotransferase
MPRSKTSSDLELLLALDRQSTDPLHRQLERALRSAVREGRLEAGSTLPSTRSLASQLGVSRGVVVESYEQLVAEGYLVSQPGGATRVARAAAAAPASRGVPESPAYRYDFRPGRPDVTEFPRGVWLGALRRALQTAPSERLTYGAGHGMPELRTALAAYLNRVRGTAADVARIVIATGFAQGLALTARALAATGARCIAVEDPTDPEYRASIEAAGLRWIAVPVDDEGLLVDRLAATDADAVVVTAAHQYPTGGVLPPERRAALVDWAEARGATIVEDDYDAEFRYDREPIGAIQGLRPDRVVYAGSASKILAPGLRLGWLVVPEWLVQPIASAKFAADMGSAALDQLAFADVIERGELDHHLRRMRPIYRSRRDAILAALARHLPDLRPTGASAGLHVLAWLPEADDLDERAILAAADSAGIGIAGVSARRIAPGPSGLVFGYGAIDEAAIEPGIRRLAEVIDGTRDRRKGDAVDGRPVVAVYGTLRRGERNHPLLGSSELLGSGSIGGRLFGLPGNGERPYGYPAFVPGSDGRVVVEVYRLPNAALLGRLDELEAYDPRDEAGSEYLRRRVPVLEGPVHDAWVYPFAGTLPLTAEPIPSGDWLMVPGIPDYRRQLPAGASGEVATPAEVGAAESGVSSARAKSRRSR